MVVVRSALRFARKDRSKERTCSSILASARSWERLAVMRSTVMIRLEVVSAPPHQTVSFLSRILEEVDGA
jgi:hypothetical protein